MRPRGLVLRVRLICVPSHGPGTLAGLLAACALLGTVAPARADDAVPNPNALAGIGGTGAATPAADALDFAQADVLTTELGVGAAGAIDAKRASVDLRFGVTVASTAWLGFRGQLLRFDVTGRPQFHDTTVSGTALQLDGWMVGTGNRDSSLCFFWFTTLCDGSTGFVGVGGSLLGFQHDTSGPRDVLRVGELDVVGSPTPAFGADWSHNRLLGRAGASWDHYAFYGGVGDRWLGRLALGLDGALRLGAVELEPSFRYRPSFSAFGDDYGLEARIDASIRSTWHGLDSAGDALRFSLQLGYAYWSVPAYSYGADWASPGKHTAFLRLVIAPSLFSAVHPAGI
jgi:hypothetical protein